MKPEFYMIFGRKGLVKQMGPNDPNYTPSQRFVFDPNTLAILSCPYWELPDFYLIKIALASQVYRSLNFDKDRAMIDVDRIA